MPGNWQEQALQLQDHQMAWYEKGAGQPLVFLHGCYDSLLYRPLGELFARNYRCILYDQRGAGGSVLPVTDEKALHVERFLEDLESLRARLGLDHLTIIGHSWGATLGLMYGGRYPQRIGRLVLIGTGPLNDEMHAVYKANVLRWMRPTDRSRWPEVNGAYTAARASGRDVPAGLDEQNIAIWSPVMFYSLANAEQFVREYLRAGGHRRHAPAARGWARKDALERAHTIKAPVLVVYGQQDYEPITQAYLLKERMPQARICFINECGHVAWVDQPGPLFKEIDSFLGSSKTTRGQ